jgi:hypothetical protein
MFDINFYFRRPVYKLLITHSLTAIFFGFFVDSMVDLRSVICQTPPIHRHLEHPGFVGEIVNLLRSTDALGSIPSIPVGGRHRSSVPVLAEWINDFIWFPRRCAAHRSVLGGDRPSGQSQRCQGKNAHQRCDNRSHNVAPFLWM